LDALDKATEDAQAVAELLKAEKERLKNSTMLCEESTKSHRSLAAAGAAYIRQRMTSLKALLQAEVASEGSSKFINLGAWREAWLGASLFKPSGTQSLTKEEQLQLAGPYITATLSMLGEQFCHDMLQEVEQAMTYMHQVGGSSHVRRAG
jgi:hypothetical protein